MKRKEKKEREKTMTKVVHEVTATLPDYEV